MTHGEAVLQAVKDLVREIERRAAETETGRRLSAELLGQLKAAGVFRMFVPESHGGMGLDLLSGMAVLETLARADGATGWTCMIGSEGPHLFALLPPAEFDNIYAAGPDVILGGGFNPQGQARVEGDGFRVTGRWGFASGSEHCDWLFGNCVVLEADGSVRPGPAPGVPATRGMLFRPTDVRIVDTWRVLGLRGTGSHDIAVEHLAVPEKHSIDIFNGIPHQPGPFFLAPSLQAGLHMGAVAIGIARGALDDVVGIIKGGKRRLYAQGTLIESELVHHQLGLAELRLRAARAGLWTECERFWRACLHAPHTLPSLNGDMLATLAFAGRAAAEVVDTCFTAAGASSVRDDSPLQRRFRDIHTFTQHAGAAERWIGHAGRALLGLPAGFGT